MELLLILACALLAWVWDHVMVLPKLREEVSRLRMDLDIAESESKDFEKRIGQLTEENLALSEELGRIKDPKYYSALDAKDGYALYLLDKERGNL